jgi:phage terminase Nu1 subunit (DNA packaging protein)
MELVGIAALIDVFGCTDRTWKTRLTEGLPVKSRGAKRGQAHTFDSVDVTDWLLNRASGDGEISPPIEKALLDRARRQMLEIQIAEKTAKLIPAATVEATWSGMTSAARSRLLALPYRLAQAAVSADGHFGTIEHAANGLIYEALAELHAYNPDDYAPKN